MQGRRQRPQRIGTLALLIQTDRAAKFDEWKFAIALLIAWPPFRGGGPDVTLTQVQGHKIYRM
jgi:hypothetical protein